MLEGLSLADLILTKPFFAFLQICGDQSGVVED